MKCIWLEEQKIRTRDLPRPIPNQDEVLIRLRLAGICRTDLELVRGYYPYSGIPGHEFVGEVVAAPQDPKWMGKRVVGEINLACGNCPACKKNLPNHCAERSVLGIVNHQGVFAEYLTLPGRNLHPLPAEIDDEAAVFVEPLAAALQIREQVPIRTSDRVLVVGAGRLGQLVARVLSLTGCRLRVVSRYARQRELLEEAGIQVADPSGLPDGSQDMVVEATGSPGGYFLALRKVRPRGTIVLKSTYRGEVAVDFSSVVVNEVTLVGSRCGPFVPAIQLLQRGLVDPVSLIEARYSLSEGPAAFQHAGRSGAMKILLNPD
jgi:threonine dehydrogenase-like Zn-dependent dehydrogenase